MNINIKHCWLQRLLSTLLQVKVEGGLILNGEENRREEIVDLYV